MLDEDRLRRLVGETVGITQPPRHLGQHPPVRPGLARCRQEGALAGDATLGIGDGAVLLAPGLRRQTDMRIRGEIGLRLAVGHHHELAARQRGTDPAAVGQADHRVGAHDPDRPDPARGDGVEQVDRLQPGPLGDARAVPELAQQRPVAGPLQVEVRGQLVGQPAHLAPAHGVGLAGQGQRPHAGLADAPRRQVHVEDGVDLVAAGRRLVDALRPGGDGLVGPCEPAIETGQVALRHAAGRGHRR